jgi:hypothetical protein
MAIGSLEAALNCSASAYATLGRTADYFPADWRLVGAFEALIGFPANRLVDSVHGQHEEPAVQVRAHPTGRLMQAVAVDQA